jgi:hypothetical protein
MEHSTLKRHASFWKPTDNDNGVGAECIELTDDQRRPYLAMYEQRIEFEMRQKQALSGAARIKHE